MVRMYLVPIIGEVTALNLRQSSSGKADHRDYMTDFATSERLKAGKSTALALNE
jgi:hypothetical protein